MKFASPAIKSIANAIVWGNQMSRRPTQDEVNGQIAAAEEQRYNEREARYADMSDDDLRDALLEQGLVFVEGDDVDDYSRQDCIRLLMASGY